MTKDVLEFEGIVIQSRGNGNFLVESEDLTISCVLSGKIRKHAIRILEGDKVKVEVSPYDLSKGRIVYRMKD